MSASLLRFFAGRKSAPAPTSATAPIARERLQILLAHERSIRGEPDLLVLLRDEILAVVSRHVRLDPDRVIVKLDRSDTVSTLEVDIELPSGCARLIAAAG